MSVFRVKSAPGCRQCGSSLAGRLVKTVAGTRAGKAVLVDVYRCRCGGGRRIARTA